MYQFLVIQYLFELVYKDDLFNIEYCSDNT